MTATHSTITTRDRRFRPRGIAQLSCTIVGVALLALVGCEPQPAADQRLPADAIPWDGPIDGFPRTPSWNPQFDWNRPLADPAVHQYRLAGRKDAVGETWIPLRLLEPMRGRWTLDPQQDSTPPRPDDLRLELRLMPRTLPRWRMVGSALLNVERDSTWIEFIQSQADQVLKLKVDCQWSDGLELTVAAHFQCVPESAPMPLTMQNLHHAEQFTTTLGQRLTAQLQWLASRTPPPGAKAAGPAAALKEQRKLLERQWKQINAAAQRLEHLKSLQQTLEQEGRLHLRLTSAATGQEWKLTPVGQASSLSPPPLSPPRLSPRHPPKSQPPSRPTPRAPTIPPREP
ncbi:MAG: hypothetical protein U0939_02275 [Pirellulales bacterium]